MICSEWVRGTAGGFVGDRSPAAEPAEHGEDVMSPAFPVHEIRLGNVEARIWEERRHCGMLRDDDFHVSIRCLGARSGGNHTWFEAEELASVADVTDIAHHWIQLQVCTAH